MHAVTKVFLLNRLGRDVFGIIQESISVRTIQGCVRNFLWRSFRRTPDWPKLSALLTDRSYKLQYLAGNRMIRNEWRSEPGSWITMLQDKETNNLALIIDECREGLWG